MHWLKALGLGFAGLVIFRAFTKKKRTEPVVQDALPEELAQVDETSESAPPSVFAVDDSVLYLEDPPFDRRICIDFGTAMSKATLIRDTSAGGSTEEVIVLKLGIPGDQQQISETLLVSSVYIDNDGKLFFGQAAVERNAKHSGSEFRQRIDNVKTYLIKDGLHDTVGPPFNPTKLRVTYQDMVLAYLMFLTWTINQCLDEMFEPRNLPRRFAIPCLKLSKATEVIAELRKLLGEAQILADTFGDDIAKGLPLEDFLEALQEVRQRQPECNFVCDDLITEPLGVATSQLSGDPANKTTMAAVFMVIDVGAGTSDFSLFKDGVPIGDVHKAMELSDPDMEPIEAGNHLDDLLITYILEEAEVDSDHPQYGQIKGSLILDIRVYKEELFTEGKTSPNLYHGVEVTISLDDFMKLDSVLKFSKTLKSRRDEIIHAMDIDNLPSSQKQLTITMPILITGGGAELPMVMSLAEGRENIGGQEFKFSHMPQFPSWLKKHYPALESVYLRIAVSLGGARKHLIERYRSGTED